MLMSRLEPQLTSCQLMVVRLLRRWAAAADCDDGALSSVMALAAELGLCPMLSVALTSLFQLVEGCLGRKLKTECCCSLALSADEVAILLLLSNATVVDCRVAGAEMPHGLPSALAWAVETIRRLAGVAEFSRLPTPGGGCPFEHRVEAREAEISHRHHASPSIDASALTHGRWRVVA